MSAPDEVLDIVGIGFGPSNLGLAIAVEEQGRITGERLTTRFYERQPTFGWHRGMLLEDATMQVSFMKDLVTLRNPASDFSFLSYLHEAGRLVEFTNYKTLFPLRIDFHAYFEWAAARVADQVTYSRTVTDVDPVIDDGAVVAYDVTAQPTNGGSPETVRARNVAIALGLTGRIPDGAELGPRVWHNLDLVQRVAALPRDPAPKRFVVLGAGQSAAEAVAYLHDEFSTAEVCSVFAKYGYAPADDSPFANRIFDPEAVDTYYDADDDVKRRLFDYHRNTNYSVVDLDLIEELYRREYRERVLGKRRLRMMNASEVARVHEEPDVVRVAVEHLPSGKVETLDADVFVYATGYQPADLFGLLGTTAGLVERSDDGEPVVHRDYRLALTTPAPAGVYVQGGTEHAHGISSTLLSNVAVRTGEIVESILTRRAQAGS